MALTSQYGEATTTLTTVYTAPAGGALVPLIHVCNKHASSSADVDVAISRSGTDRYQWRTTTVPIGAPGRVIDGPLHLASGDQLRIRASVAAAIDFTVTVDEL